MGSSVSRSLNREECTTPQPVSRNNCETEQVVVLRRELDPRSPSAGIERTPLQVITGMRSRVEPVGTAVTPLGNRVEAPPRVRDLRARLLDPRSPTVGIQRTPIQMNEVENKYYNKAQLIDLQDPRSPSENIYRTPIQQLKSTDTNDVSLGGESYNYEVPHFSDSMIDDEGEENLTHKTSHMSLSYESAATAKIAVDYTSAAVDNAIAAVGSAATAAAVAIDKDSLAAAAVNLAAAYSGDESDITPALASLADTEPAFIDLYATAAITMTDAAVTKPATDFTTTCKASDSDAAMISTVVLANSDDATPAATDSHVITAFAPTAVTTIANIISAAIASAVTSTSTNAAVSNVSTTCCHPPHQNLTSLLPSFSKPVSKEPEGVMFSRDKKSSNGTSLVRGSSSATAISSGIGLETSNKESGFSTTSMPSRSMMTSSNGSDSLLSYNTESLPSKSGAMTKSSSVASSPVSYSAAAMSRSTVMTSKINSGSPLRLNATSNSAKSAKATSKNDSNSPLNFSTGSASRSMMISSNGSGSPLSLYNENTPRRRVQRMQAQRAEILKGDVVEGKGWGVGDNQVGNRQSPVCRSNEDKENM